MIAVGCERTKGGDGTGYVVVVGGIVVIGGVVVVSGVSRVMVIIVMVKVRVSVMDGVSVSKTDYRCGIEQCGCVEVGVICFDCEGVAVYLADGAAAGYLQDGEVVIVDGLSSAGGEAFL